MKKKKKRSSSSRADYRALKHVLSRSPAGHHDDDRLSSLPDDLLGHILSFLPTQQAVRTSQLSRRWRRVWPTQARALNLSFRDCRRLRSSLRALATGALARLPPAGRHPLHLRRARPPRRHDQRVVPRRHGARRRLRAHRRAAAQRGQPDGAPSLHARGGHGAEAHPHGRPRAPHHHQPATRLRQLGRAQPLHGAAPRRHAALARVPLLLLPVPQDPAALLRQRRGRRAGPTLGRPPGARPQQRRRPREPPRCRRQPPVAERALLLQVVTPCW